jgi:hypothetical protein
MTDEFCRMGIDYRAISYDTLPTLFELMSQIAGRIGKTLVSVFA